MSSLVMRHSLPTIGLNERLCGLAIPSASVLLEPSLHFAKLEPQILAIFVVWQIPLFGLRVDPAHSRSQYIRQLVWAYELHQCVHPPSSPRFD
jgi:hypothetical protein